MKYFEGFSNYDDLTSQWGGKDMPTDEQILLAIYTYENYEGAAFCLFERDGKLFEVYDYHCSCRGLENWEPEETSWQALAMYDKHWGVEADETLAALIKSRLETK